jgi:hypothetical protein
MFLAGCASSGSGVARRSSGADDMAAYDQLVAESRQAAAASLAALEQVAACGTNCPPAVVTAFQRNVDDFDVGSLSVREHFHAILARGDKFFDTWEQQVAQMKEPGPRALAEQRRTQLLDSFHRIEACSSQTSGDFQRFLAGLQQLADQLDVNPGCLATPPTQALIAATETSGRQMEQDLDSAKKQLDDFRAMVNSIESAGKK